MGIFNKSDTSKVIKKATKLGATEHDVIDAWQGFDGYATHYLLLYPTHLEMYKGGASAHFSNTHGSSNTVNLTQLESVAINREGFLRNMIFRGPGFDLTFPAGRKDAPKIRQVVLETQRRTSV